MYNDIYSYSHRLESKVEPVVYALVDTEEIWWARELVERVVK